MIPSALNRLGEILAPARDKRIAMFLDYDGTLTPIVSHPEDAWLSDSMRRTLRELAARMPVAISSGRDLDDVRRRVDIAGIVYAGSHGFDIAGPHGLRRQMASEFLPKLDMAEKKLQQAVGEVAWRHRELRKMTGKKVHELQPDIDWDKGRALMWLLETLALEGGNI